MSDEEESQHVARIVEKTLRAASIDPTQPRPKSSLWAQYGGIVTIVLSSITAIGMVFGWVCGFQELPERVATCEKNIAEIKLKSEIQGDDLAAIKQGIQDGNLTTGRILDRLDKIK